MLKITFKFIGLVFLINSCTNKPINNSALEYKKLTTQIDTIFQNYIEKNYINDDFLQYYDKVAVNCDSVNKILHNVHKTDQDVRMTGEGEMYTIDSINQIKVISIFSKCKVDDLDQQSITAVFLMLQHSADNDLKAYFYNYIKNNLRSKYELAMYVDGFLMIDNKPQIFGTYLDNKNKLYKVKDRKNLNKRRKAFGIKPIEYYLELRGAEE